MSIVLGLMSGTSLDGLDLCCVRFADNHNAFQILAAQTVTYSPEWKSKLENAFFVKRIDFSCRVKECVFEF
jgi:anhydro-N-acetylmuramic acid kinase